MLSQLFRLNVMAVGLFKGPSLGNNDILLSAKGEEMPWQSRRVGKSSSGPAMAALSLWLMTYRLVAGAPTSLADPRPQAVSDW